jgi:hypothetical protein
VRAKPTVRQPRARAVASARAPSSPSASKAIAMSSGSHSSAACAASAPPSAASPMAGSARLPTITGWTNSTATWRASERAAGEEPKATSRPPRAKRSAIR